MIRGWVYHRTYGWDGRDMSDMSDMSGRRYFVAYWHYVAWHCVSFGLSISVQQPNIEIHLPFGFFRIGWKTSSESMQPQMAWHERVRLWKWKRDLKRAFRDAGEGLEEP